MKLSKQFNLYESDHTKFIKELKASNPAIEEGQRAGRALLWDKAPISLTDQEKTAQSRLSQQAYVYQTKV